MPNWAEVGAVLHGVERWLLPAECLLCERPIGNEPGDPLVCQVCRSRWVRIPQPICKRCGQPRDGDLECWICADWPAGFGPVRSAVWLAGTARAAVHHLKYNGWWRVVEAMAPVLVPLLPGSHGFTLVPVPLGRARQRERGYNQSARLARAVGARVTAPIQDAILHRTRDTARQTGLAPGARQANVTGAFTASRRMHGVVVLVDDVFTTGATLVAAAAALLDVGAERVEAVTFARARRPLDDDVEHLAADTWRQPSTQR